ncbi:hypothetical protein WHR41_05957 [Cladosporium halotolerans]|uniref:Calcineurin-like phosphoesterase domain-containing protein n=1 Tax=Cladosporium halotolerans TaxID=1052096 RepID=A0AB34KKS7_9PEZI
MSQPTIKTRVLIISDTHNAPLSEKGDGKPIAPFKSPLPSADLLIHCGDLTMTGQQDEYHRTLDMLSEISAPVKLVIAGNHDLSLDRDFVSSHRTHDPQRRQPPSMSEEDADARVNAARDLWTAPDGRAKQEGVTYLDEGLHTIPLPNGAVATVYASPYTPEFWDWAFPYERHEDRFNGPGTALSDAVSIAPYPMPTRSKAVRPVDIVMTHGPPWKRLDPTARVEAVGCPHLLRALMRARPTLCCFGHIHEGWGAERVMWAEGAEEVPGKACSIEEWQKGGWEDGVKARGGGGGLDITPIKCDAEAAREKRAEFIDISKEGSKAITPGEETLFVNAAIMDVAYRPVNAPWVVDLDLPAR